MKKIFSFFRHLFVPHENNDYQAKAIHLDFLSFYLVLALFLTFSYRFLSQTKLNVLGFATDITVEKLYQLTNEVRQKYKLAPLNYNEKLSQAAYLKAQDMFGKNYWAHYAPDGKTPWEFILKAGYQYEYAGENLAKNFLFSQGVIDAWMNSPSHRENILKKEYQEVGFAVVNGVLNNEETTLVVQMFGAPSEGKLLTKEEPFPLTKPVAAQENLAQKNPILVSQNKKIVSSSTGPLVFNYRFNTIFFSLIFIAFITDLYFAHRLGLIHWRRKNIIHLLFVFFILMSLLIISKGAII